MQHVLLSQTHWKVPDVTLIYDSLSLDQETVINPRRWSAVMSGWSGDEEMIEDKTVLGNKDQEPFTLTFTPIHSFILEIQKLFFVEQDSLTYSLKPGLF